MYLKQFNGVQNIIFNFHFNKNFFAYKIDIFKSSPNFGEKA